MRREDTLGQALHVAGGQRQKKLPDARRRRRIGAPIGNQNALKSGLFTREAIKERRALRAMMRSARQLALKIE